jgi:hypothetical protein
MDAEIKQAAEVLAEHLMESSAQEIILPVEDLYWDYEFEVIIRYKE